ncbi:MAG: hypothetical protein ACYTF9_13685, partial [Planctomycetota bacterium]
MNVSPARVVLASIGVLVVGWVALKAANLAYFDKAEELQSGIDKWNGYLADVRDERPKRRKANDTLQAFVDRTLGGDDEQVTHQLRGRLNRIGESIGLTETFVNSSRGTGRQSPARRSELRDLTRELRDEFDFVELQGTLKGKGTFEQALRAVHMIDAQTWPHRIDEVRLDPGPDGAQFTIGIKVTTAYLPGETPEATPAAIEDPPG